MNGEAVSQVSRSASGVTLSVTQKANKFVSGFFLRFAQFGTRPTPIKHFATYGTTSGFLPAQNPVGRRNHFVSR
jgi:hypothetical protein